MCSCYCETAFLCRVIFLLGQLSSAVTGCSAGLLCQQVSVAGNLTHGSHTGVSRGSQGTLITPTADREEHWCWQWWNLWGGGKCEKASSRLLLRNWVMLSLAFNIACSYGNHKQLPTQGYNRYWSPHRFFSRVWSCKQVSVPEHSVLSVLLQTRAQLIQVSRWTSPREESQFILLQHHYSRREHADSYVCSVIRPK